jgi:hypothetical protein
MNDDDEWGPQWNGDDSVPEWTKSVIVSCVVLVGALVICSATAYLLHSLILGFVS